MSLSRRHVLAMGALAGLSAAGTWAAPENSVAARDASAARHIGFTNLHTGEHVEVEYRRNGKYLVPALTSIESVLRDFRNGERHAIDPALMDYLVDVAAGVGREARFNVISGYRSPQTNERLHERSSGVAQHSLHMEGRAIDVRLPGVDCADLASQALKMQRGGVGYYRASDFVHLDTGAFRTWRG
jgi:uncharacterized protein YcbK (DUF882 family)